MVNFIVNRFISILHFFVRIFKKALCCLRRRRRPSCEPIPLTNVGVIPSIEKVGPELQNWNSWEEAPTVVTDYSGKPLDPVQQQIEMYRQQRMSAPVDPDAAEQHVDFFEDMTPRITRQTKIMIQQQQADQCHKTDFSLAPNPVFNTSELGVWEDSQSWEDQAQEDWDVNEVLKEQKRLDRERRLAELQRKKSERDFRSGRHVIATRLS